jgi:NTP pyrophosphatase (non-canonical NTP hydrolase)
MSDMEGYSDESTTIAILSERLSKFNADREWETFHEPKDLAMCLAAEAGELLEPFLWKRPGESLDRTQIEEELADILICAVNLSARLKIDLMAAVDRKIQTNAKRYPIEKSRGQAKKYTNL